MADHDYLKKQIERAFPELSGGLHLDRYARVVAIADAPEKGSASERFRPRFAVDIEILTPDMEPDPKYPKYTAVPLPVPLGAGGEAGAFAFPAPGSLVVVGFAYGRHDHPIIRQIYPLGDNLPDLKSEEILLQRSPDVFQKADENGNWIRSTTSTIFDESVDLRIKAVSSKKEVGNETTRVTEHSTKEVDGMATLEVGTQLTILAGTRADIGTLGDYNCIAGANSTANTGKNATEKVGGNHTSVVQLDRFISILGKRIEEVKKDQALTVSGDMTDTVEGKRSVKIAGSRTDQVGGNKNLIVEGGHKDVAKGNREIQAANVIFKAKGKFTIISEDGKGNGISFYEELLECLREIKQALDVLSTHTHPKVDTISQGASVASHAAKAAGHLQRMKSITE